MSYLVSPEFARVLLLGGIVTVQSKWKTLVNSTVPAPYLDEVFHIPQAQAYWQGNWTQWDSKITTPPGLYVYSYIFSSIRNILDSTVEQSTEDLRFSNTFLLYLLLIALYIWSAVNRSDVRPSNILQKEFNIILFPLLFFFSGLYYTDIFSVLSVVVTYTFWSASVQPNSNKLLWQSFMFVSGLISLASRQTNIFWVGVFLGGLQVIESVKGKVGERGVHDPEISKAYFEDFPIMGISIAHPALTMIPQLLLDLWPHLSLLVCFAFFVLWNGGVVLGDKSNHIATLHAPQLLYLFPTIIFFSWPTIVLPRLPHLLANPINPTNYLRSKLPRPAFTLITTLLILLTIHFNTIIHPFTLADNRHYTFYVFRLLIFKHWGVKYLAAPVYFISAWLVITIGWGATAPSSFSSPATTNNNIKSAERSGGGGGGGSRTKQVTVSFALVWLVSSTLSLVTAPLVEPRYFIVPWLIWRLHVPEHTSSPVSVSSSGGTQAPQLLEGTKQTSSASSSNKAKQSAWSVSRVLDLLAQYHLWVELIWYLAINYVTCYLFLYRGFTWPQEPGNVQRFMW